MHFEAFRWHSKFAFLLRFYSVFCFSSLFAGIHKIAFFAAIPYRGMHLRQGLSLALKFRIFAAEIQVFFAFQGLSLALKIRIFTAIPSCFLHFEPFRRHSKFVFLLRFYSVFCFSRPFAGIPISHFRCGAHYRGMHLRQGLSLALKIHIFTEDPIQCFLRHFGPFAGTQTFAFLLGSHSGFCHFEAFRWHSKFAFLLRSP